MSGLEEFARELFHDISPYKENREMNIYVIKARYENIEGQKDALVLLDAFVELIGNMTISIRKYLGESLVAEAAQEAVKILSMVEKYQQDKTITEKYMAIFQG